MDKTWNNKAWFMVLPVLVLVAFSAVIPLMTVVNYSVQDTFGNNQFFWAGTEWFQEVLESDRFWAALSRNLIFSAIILAIEVPLGIAIALAIPAQQLNIAFLVALAFAVAASANLPSVLYNLFWKRFNTRGATWSIYGGLITCLVLVACSPVVSGSETALFTEQDWSWFPLANPGIISIPAGFFFGWLGSVTSDEPTAVARFEELEVRSLTGAGSEKVVTH